MKKLVIGVSSMIVFVSILIFWGGLSTLKIETEIPLIQSRVTSRILIPITIKDSSYLFLWDTGADKSMILEKRIKEMPIEVSDVKTIQTVVHARERVTFESRVGSLRAAKIGDISLPDQEIEVSDFNRLFDAHKPEVVGLIGQDIISKFHWLIDFNSKVVRISNNSFSQEDLKGKAFVLPFTYGNKRSKVPFVNLVFNDSISDKFLFDTGWSFGITLKSKVDNRSMTLNPTIVFNKNRDKINFQSNKVVELEDVSGSPIKEHRKILTIDSIDINEKNFKNLVVSEEILFETLNICSFHFVELFSKMYYNPRDKKIILIYP